MTHSRMPWPDAWLVAAKDLIAVAIWALSFAGRKVIWRGQRYHVRKDGTLQEIPSISEAACP
jgi:ceramide glucosyltransferase